MNFHIVKYLFYLLKICAKLEFIIGMGAVIWILILALIIFGYDWLNIKIFQSWNILIPFLTLPLIAIIYVIGIITDRIADSLLVPIDIRARDRGSKEAKVKKDYHYIRTYVFYQSNKFKDIFDYSRGKLRVCRAWIFNFILIGITLAIFIWIRFSEYSFILRFKLSTFGLIINILLAIGSWFTWHRLTQYYYGRIFHAYKVIRKLVKKDEIKNKKLNNS